MYLSWPLGAANTCGTLKEGLGAAVYELCHGTRGREGGGGGEEGKRRGSEQSSEVEAVAWQSDAAVILSAPPDMSFGLGGNECLTWRSRHGGNERSDMAVLTWLT